ncbi:PKD domain-containing protein [Algicola sagamiensis]|uniref:PKD domain-containing protein n=1 Tax=Algicola sagamiensis TaxID=163869 RepID=UPI0003724543|nr:proprotein convertase P-domain-containing protein [Algicola sagamiensis]
MRVLHPAAISTAIGLALFSQTPRAETTYQRGIQTNIPSTGLPATLAKTELDMAEHAIQRLLKDASFSDNTSFQQIRKKESLLAVHFTFAQWVTGIPVADATLTISINKHSGEIIRAYHHVLDTKHYPLAKHQTLITASDATRVAIENLKTTGSLNIAPDVTLVLYPHNKTLVKAYRVLTSLTKPAGDWLQYVHAETGEILHLEQRSLFEKDNQSKDADIGVQSRFKPSHFQTETITQVNAADVLAKMDHITMMTTSTLDTSTDDTSTEAFVEGKGRIFDPDPRTALKDTAFALLDNSDPSAFADAYREATLPEVTKVTLDDNSHIFLLKSSWVMIEDHEKPDAAPTASTDGTWLYQRGEQGFDDTNTFYHIHQNQGYLQKLGYNNIQNRPIPVDTNGNEGKDNSYYSTATRKLSFGHGGVNDTEDATVILHEYGHAISMDINPDFFGGDAGAMGEGFGDYWAASYKLTTSNGKDTFPNRVFIWDMGNKARYLNDVEARYDDQRNYRAHQMVDGVKSRADQLWSTPLYQSLLELIEKGVEQEDVDKIILESQYGIGAKPTMRDMAMSILTTATTLYKDGPHAEVFLKHFKHHHIIKEDMTLESVVLDAAGDDIFMPGETVSLMPTFQNNTAFDLKDATVNLTTTSGIDITYGQENMGRIASQLLTKPTQPLTFDIPENTQCASNIQYQIDYEGTVDGETVQFSESFEKTIGAPLYHRWIRVDPFQIPDNKKIIYSALDIEKTGQTVKNLRVDVHIKHPYRGDLAMKLKSPKGTEIFLAMSNLDGKDNYIGTFPTTLTPVETLSKFEGEDLDGQWRLYIRDDSSGDKGEVISWGLQSHGKPVCENKLLPIESITMFEGDEAVLEAQTTLPLEDKMTIEWQQVDTSTIDLNGKSENGEFHFQAPLVDQDKNIELTYILKKNGNLLETRNVAVLIKKNLKEPVIKQYYRQVAFEGKETTLDPEAEDPNGLALTYHWAQVDKSPYQIKLPDPTAEKLVFTAPFVPTPKFFLHKTVIEIELTVTNSRSVSTKKTFFISIKDLNKAPTLEKLQDAIVTENTPVTIKAQADDKDGNDLTYTWKQQQNGQRKINFTGQGTDTISFTAPKVKETKVLTFEVSASDGSENSETRYVNIVVQPQVTTEPPAHHEPTEQLSTTAPHSITLTVPSLTDPQGDITYQWKRLDKTDFDFANLDNDSQLLTLDFKAYSLKESSLFHFQVKATDSKKIIVKEYVVIAHPAQDDTPDNTYQATQLINVDQTQTVTMVAPIQPIPSDAVKRVWHRLDKVNTTLPEPQENAEQFTIDFSTLEITKFTTFHYRVKVTAEDKSVVQEYFVQVSPKTRKTKQIKSEVRSLGKVRKLNLTAPSIGSPVGEVTYQWSQIDKSPQRIAMKDPNTEKFNLDLSALNMQKETVFELQVTVKDEAIRLVKSFFVIAKPTPVSNDDKDTDEDSGHDADTPNNDKPDTGTTKPEQPSDKQKQPKDNGGSVFWTFSLLALLVIRRKL